MITLEDIKGYWEFYEFPTSEKRIDSILDLVNSFEKKVNEEVSKLDIKTVDTKFYISPHSLIRVMQSDIELRVLTNSFSFTLNSHLIYLKTGKVPYNTFQGNLKVHEAALDRVEMKNRNIFIVYKTRHEARFLNRLDFISIGVPGVRPRNSKKPPEWESMTNDDKKAYFLKKEEV